jgi:hypothetical protein
MLVRSILRPFTMLLLSIASITILNMHHCLVILRFHCCFVIHLDYFLLRCSGFPLQLLSRLTLC